MGKNALLTPDQLTALEGAFVRHCVDGADPTQAVLSAGYRTETPKSVARALLRTPHILVALQREIARALMSDAVVARNVALELMNSDQVSAKVRADLAIKLLGMAGYVAPRKKDDNANKTLPLHEMKIGELRDLAAKLDDEIAGRAQPINAIPAPADSQLSDIVD